MVLGNVEIAGRKVILSVNSEARCERGRALLEPVLRGLGRPPLVERQDLEQQLEEHYCQALDQPDPAPGNVSPRRAVRTAKGRERVPAWLETLENHSSKRPADDPIGEYVFAWMWHELGVAELRK
jgi:hypothetical protein